MAESLRHKFFYKQVAIVSGRFFAIEDGRTEFALGETRHEPGKPGFIVYRTPEEALLAAPPPREGAVSIAPRTILRVIAWGDSSELPNSGIAFAYLCPVLNVGLPRGYLGSRYGLVRSGNRRLASRIKQPSPGTKRLLDLPYWEKLSLPVRVPAPSRTRREKGPLTSKRSIDTPGGIVKSARTYRVSQSVPRRAPRKMSPISYRTKLERMADDTKRLEQEVEALEKKAALLKLEEDWEPSDSNDASLARIP